MEDTIRIVVDCVKFSTCHYVEDTFSEFEIVNMDKDVFIEMMKSFVEEYGEIHTCYSAFINHCGRFHREFGPNWAGATIEIQAPTKPGTGDMNYKNYEFNEKGQLMDWPYGMFG